MPLLLLACAADPAGTVDSAGALALPAVQILLPTGDEPVAAGDVAFSVVVDNFTLVDPKHNDEGDVASGYLAVNLDGAEVDRVAATQFAVSLPPGEIVVQLVLHYDDGDAVEPPAIDAVTLVVE